MRVELEEGRDGWEGMLWRAQESLFDGGEVVGLESVGCDVSSDEVFE